MYGFIKSLQIIYRVNYQILIDKYTIFLEQHQHSYTP